MNFIEEKLIPIFGKIGSQRHLSAIRDGFVALIPLLTVGSFAVLINNLPIDAYQTFMANIFGDGWKNFGGNIWWGSIAIISIFVAFTVAYSLAKSYDSDGLAAGIISVACYFIFVPQSPTVISPGGESFAAWGNINWAFTNAGGMFVALLIALLSTELFVRLRKSPKLVINMPDGVPPAVSKSFAALFPGAITLIVFSLISLTFIAGATTIFAVIEKFFAAPMRTVADSFGSALFIPFFGSFLWFFGLHGANIIGGVIEPLLLPMAQANADAAILGQIPEHIVTKPFLDAFVYIGGSGATLCLLLAILIAARSKMTKSIGKIGIAPGCFNINEVVIYGLPIVLNPMMLVPFLLTPMVLSGFSYLVIAAGIVPKTIVAMLPWITPPVLSGFLATGSIAGSILQLVEIAIGTLIYLPFVIASDRENLKLERSEESAKAKIS